MMANINYLSILIAGVAAWLFGAVYYTALSGPWMAAQGKTMEDCKAEMAGKSKLEMYLPFVLAFVGSLIMAWALYGVLVHLKIVQHPRRHDLRRHHLVRIHSHDHDGQQRLPRQAADADRDRQPALAWRAADHGPDRRLDGAVSPGTLTRS